MALASALGARACLQDRRDTVFSAAQIWDCAGDDVATCADGTLLRPLIRVLATRSALALLVVGGRSDPALIVSNPNETTCLERHVHRGGSSASPYVLQGGLFMDVVHFLMAATATTTTTIAMRAMMAELRANGPVVSVLTLRDDDDVVRFLRLGTGHPVFEPGATTTTNATSRRHCIMVYGWGVDPATGIRFWRVQNSYGTDWGDNGTARIVRGLGVLEDEWRAVSTTPRPCDNTTSSGCLPALPTKRTSSSSAAKLLLSSFLEQQKDNNANAFFLLTALLGLSVALVSVASFMLCLLLHRRRRG
jgi:hypothetical protein